MINLLLGCFTGGSSFADNNLLADVMLNIASKTFLDSGSFVSGRVMFSASELSSASSLSQTMLRSTSWIDEPLETLQQKMFVNTLNILSDMTTTSASEMSYLKAGQNFVHTSLACFCIDMLRLERQPEIYMIVRWKNCLIVYLPINQSILFIVKKRKKSLLIHLQHWINTYKTKKDLLILLFLFNLVNW